MKRVDHGIVNFVVGFPPWEWTDRETMSNYPISRESAEDEAKSLINSEWAERGLPVDPTYIAKQVGVSVFEVDLAGDIDAILKYYRGGSTPAIFVDPSSSLNRKRFSIAHELGHFVLNSRLDPKGGILETDTFYRDGNSQTGDDPVEVFANQFAAELLMPSRFVRSLADQGKTDLVMAADFGVSLEALRNRLNTLKIKLDTFTG
jgi:Zn-dependent peptidase ImmA (M78 family)